MAKKTGVGMVVFCAYTQQKKMLTVLLLEYAEKQKSAFEDIFQSGNTKKPNKQFNLTMVMYATGPDNAPKVKAESVIPASIALTRPLQVKQMFCGRDKEES